MNVINYIASLSNGFELFAQTVESDFRSLHFAGPWESGFVFVILEKNAVETLDQAVILSVVHFFRKYGDYYFGQTPLEEVYEKCMDHLNDAYKENRFGITEKIALKDIIGRYNLEAQRRAYKNDEWNIPLDFNIENMDWTQEDSIRTYHLKSEWNDEDYLFETRNYFIRFNWYTSA
ncbi:hypothetical protein D3C87_94770 [compost metagenome]